VATSPLTASSAEFRDVVRQIASVDTLDGFLRELYSRFPETGSFVGAAAPAPTAPVTPAGATPAVAPGNAQMRRAADPNPTASLGLRSSMRP
jgi:hypothetical protein